MAVLVYQPTNRNTMVKTPKRLQDPFSEREAAKYENPIPSREYVLALLDKHGKPMTLEEVIEALALVDPEQQEALRRRLIAMSRDGQLIHTRRDGYGIAANMGLIRGRVLAHRDGFGFLQPDDGSKDLFLPERQMRKVFHGDRVVVRITGEDRRGRREAAIVEVLERSTTQVVGRLLSEGGAYFVLPDNKLIRHQVLIPNDALAGATAGQIVVVGITVQPSKMTYPVGRVVEVLGEHMAPGMEIDIALRSYDLPHVWPTEVVAEANAFSPTVLEKDAHGRLDLRELPLVTIDGKDAKDFDDAVYCERKGRGWRLFVAIADVAHYVHSGTALDKEAENRGNSVYFPENVIPMLPEVLSNGLCSLNPLVDRLCMAAEIILDAKGNIKSYQFHNAIIKSHARLTYEQVWDMLNDDIALQKKYHQLLPHIIDLYELYQRLHENREERGAIDFEFPETQIVFTEDRKIAEIVPRYRNDAHRLIEECMLVANVCAAEFLKKHKMPALFRNHLGPDPDKLQQVREFLAPLGLQLRGGLNPKPKDYAKVLLQAAKREDATLIQMVLLRSLAQAVYAANNEGHFGLAFEAYAHFTSPIRRYPDLLVHRAIKYCLSSKKPKRFTYTEEEMTRLGSHCSMTERRADDATRAAVDWLKCEFMLDKIGKIYPGKVSGVTAFGLFITLDELFVDGLVHVTSLKDDYYSFNPKQHSLTGQRTGLQYKQGQALIVQVAGVNLDDRKIDFTLASQETESSHPTKAKKTTARKKRKK